MSTCPTHGVTLGAFGDCPSCKAAERRQEESIAAQASAARDQVEAIRNQTELLREAQESEAERAFEAQVALDQMAAATRARLEDERRHRQIEETRACLRAGVQELAPALQLKWQRLNAALSEALGAEKLFAESQIRYRLAHQEASRSLDAEFKRLVEQEAPRVLGQLKSGGGAHLDSLPQNILAAGDTVRPLQEAMEEVRRCIGGYLPTAARWGSSDVTRVTTLWPALQEISAAVTETKEPVLPFPLRAGGWFHLPLGCLTFFLGTLVAAAFASLFGISPEKVLPFAYLAMGAGIYLPWALARALRRKLQERLKTYQALQKAGSSLAKALSTALNSPGTAGLPDVLVALRDRLAGGVVLRKLSDMPDAETYFTLKKNCDDVAQQLGSAEQAFEGERAARESVKQEYSFLRTEILRVGKEVIEGIRPPGHRLESTNCSRCGGPITSETRRCPYCSGGV